VVPSTWVRTPSHTISYNYGNSWQF